MSGNAENFDPAFQEKLKELFLQGGVDPNDYLWSCASGNHRTGFEVSTMGLRIALAAGADVNVADANKRTALICAAENGNVAAVKLLLEHGADRNLKANPAMYGLTPEYKTTEWTALNIVRYQIKSYRPSNGYDGEYRTKEQIQSPLLEIITILENEPPVPKYVRPTFNPDGPPT